MVRDTNGFKHLKEESETLSLISNKVIPVWSHPPIPLSQESRIISNKDGISGWVPGTIYKIEQN